MEHSSLENSLSVITDGLAGRFDETNVLNLSPKVLADGLNRESLGLRSFVGNTVIVGETGVLEELVSDTSRPPIPARTVRHFRCRYTQRGQQRD